MNPAKQQNYQCIFCGETIRAGGLDPCALHLVAKFDQPRRAQKEQTFFCHIKCMESRASSHPATFYINDPDFPTVGEVETNS